MARRPNQGVSVRHFAFDDCVKRYDRAAGMTQLVTERASLEDAFMNLTHNSVEYRAVDEAEPIKESVA